MSDLVKTAIAEGLASLSRAVETPVAPFGWGSDVACGASVDLGTELAGDDALVLAQAIARRLDTPRGGLLDDPNYGLDLKAELNRGTTATTLNDLAARIRLECTKDDRIRSVVVTVVASPDGRSLRVSLRVTPVASTVGGFAFVLAVTSGAVLVEELARAA